MRLLNRAVLIIIIFFSCVGCDQVTKAVARHNLAESGTVRFLGGLLRLQYTENPGAFLGLGANASEPFRYWVFIISTGLFLAAVLAFLLVSKRISMAPSMAISLLLSGGVGNLIDRIWNEGRVIDFMNLGIGSLRTGVFNVADIAILAGCIWLVICYARKPEIAL